MTTAGLDPIEALLALNLISPEIVAASERVPPDVARTRAGRLIAAGADAAALMPQLSQLSGVPLADPVLLDRRPLEVWPHAIANELRGLLACPVDRDLGGIVVVIADPASRERVGQLLPSSTVYLAPESEVRQILARPSVSDREEHVLRDVGKSVEKPWEPPSDAHQRKPAPVPRTRTPGPMTSPLPRPPTPPPQTTAGATPARPVSPPPQNNLPSPDDLKQLTGTTATGPGRVDMMRAFSSGMIVGALLMGIACAAIYFVVLRPMSAASEAAPVVDDRPQRQQKLLDEARASAAKGDHAWAIARADDAYRIDPVSTLAAHALVVVGTSRIALGDLDGKQELNRAVRLLPVDDPVRAQAERALK